MKEKNQTRLLWVAVPLLLVGQFSSCGSGAIVASAREYQDSVVGRVEEARSVFKETEQLFTQAKQVHNPAYLEGRSLEFASDTFEKIDGYLAIASESNSPVKIRQAAYQASLLTRQAVKPAEDLRAYIQFLDKAKDSYQSEPELVRQEIGLIESTIGDYVAQGYFPKHFTSAKELLETAREHTDSSVGIGREIVWNNLPDYKQAYEVCLLARSKVDQSSISADAIPALRAENHQRIASLEKRLEQTLSRYSQARRSAQNLEKYPAYRCLMTVERARGSLNSTDVIFAQAKNLNDMAIQEFAQAKAAVDGISKQLTSATTVFDQAISGWQSVLTAINQFDDIERQAKRAISDAASRINSYDHNTQLSAESYLDNARAHLRQGQRLISSDPPKAVKELRQAKNAADDAYDAVDTSSDDVYVGTSSGGSSGYDYGTSGGYGGGSYGGSSGGYGGGSDSFSSGPSGSYSSGPSGSYGDGGF